MTTKDVSAGGFCLVVNEPIDQGTRMRAEITLPGGRCVPFIGEVTWSDQYKLSSARESKRSYEIGVRLVKISPVDRELVKRHVMFRA